MFQMKYARGVWRLPKMFFCANLLAHIAFLTACTTLFGQPAKAGRPLLAQVGSGDIINELAPNSIPPSSLVLRSAQRTRAVRLLLVAKQQETGLRRQIAVYLLATLGQDYRDNLDELLRVWHGCVVKNLVQGCDENTGDMLIKLYQQGHREVLRPILAGCRHSDGALSEELYPFYADQLEHSSKDFVTALATLQLDDQVYLCTQIGRDVCEQSGGGPMNGSLPKAMRTVLANLKENGGEVADRCSRAAQQGYRDQRAGILEEEKGPGAAQR